MGSCCKGGHSNGEKFNHQTRQWEQIDQYPYAYVIHYAPVVSRGADFFVFGGQNYYMEEYPISAVIAKYTDEWSQVGVLSKPRYG